MYDLSVEIDPPITPFLIKEVLAKLAYLDERVRGATISGDGGQVILSVHQGLEAETRAALGERVRFLVTAMSSGGFEPTLRTIETHTFPQPGTVDPMPELMAAGEVVPEGPGYFGLGPLLSSVIEVFERRLMEVATDMGAAPYRFPALISPAYLEKVQYFKNFPHSLSFATHLRENLPDIERFSAEARTDDGRVVTDAALYAPAAAMLAPTVCHHLYLALAGKRLPAGGLTATACGHCFRYESRNMVSLERLWNFTMREIIFVGSEEHVRTSLAKAQDRVREILIEFQISHELKTANDPFFIGTFRDQVAYQAAFELKYEIRAALPFKADTVAIGSYNRHGDFFGRTMDIGLEDGSPAHTGCFGLGFERMAYAFVAQHTANPANWPSTIREAVATRRGSLSSYAVPT